MFDTMPRISIGRTVVTKAIAAHLERTPTDTPAVAAALLRHQRGDWGEVTANDARANDFAVGAGECLLSAYTLPSGERVWIITEWDCSVTRVLLPSDYLVGRFSFESRAREAPPA